MCVGRRPWFGESLAGATHGCGGEIYYTHLGGSEYLVTLKVYRDCGPANTLGTGFDDQVYIGMWDGPEPSDSMTSSRFH